MRSTNNPTNTILSRPEDIKLIFSRNTENTTPYNIACKIIRMLAERELKNISDSFFSFEIPKKQFFHTI